MSHQPGLLREGFSRVWRYQRVLWFIFFINLVLAHFGASPTIHKLDWATDHSLHAQRLSNMFDVGSFSELASNPEVKLFEVGGVSISLSLVFFVIVLFLTGGILEAYRSGRKLTTREFFEACGSYFWRWVRLFILMGIVLIPALMLVSLVWKQANSLMGSAAQEKAGFWILVAVMGAVGILLMCIRLWFDMAQVRAVVEEETGMWRNAGRAFKLTFSNFGSLFWMYFRISVMGWLVFAAGLYVWAKMPPARFQWTFVVLEIVVLCGFGTRLWQRASEMVWYQRHFLAPAVMPVPVTPPPSPLLTIAPVSAPPSQP
ncbi:MAG: hypothetical protein HY233_00550 [Acidobacteriales bacterium]|nr:hypothetical protein [Candidatus Koribacter versatilis]MBI3644449.1 hypothetical protein [Terriglobales bacterium]